MRQLFFVLFVLVFLRPATAEISGGPEEFLTAVLSADFSGDTRARLGKCHFTDGRFVAAECVNRQCAERREAFHPVTDPLTIVSNWTILASSQEDRGRVSFMVQYTVIAVTEGENERRKIVSLPAPREEEVTYKVWKRKGQWFWVDPPEVPYVGYEGARMALKRHIAHFEELIAEKVDNPLVERHLPFYRQQLAALEALRPMTAPPSSP